MIRAAAHRVGVSLGRATEDSLKERPIFMLQEEPERLMKVCSAARPVDESAMSSFCQPRVGTLLHVLIICAAYSTVRVQVRLR